MEQLPDPVMDTTYAIRIAHACGCYVCSYSDLLSIIVTFKSSGCNLGLLQKKIQVIKIVFFQNSVLNRSKYGQGSSFVISYLDL